ncbi:MAG: hypothetical protein GY804_07270 [Alphaproteobacteria bacterium]|nr:hypothetical protein [Alphaproteobacteria bacterium]
MLSEEQQKAVKKLPRSKRDFRQIEFEVLSEGAKKKAADFCVEKVNSEKKSRIAN